MEGGIAILLIVIILGLVAVGVFFLGGARTAARHAPDDDEGGPRPTHRKPNPEQQEQEKGTAFPG
jgi:hypothetical protein